MALPLKNYEDIKSSGFFIDEEIYLLEAEENYQGHNAEEQLTLKQIESKTGFKDRYIWVSSYSGLTKDSHGSTSKQDVITSYSIHYTKLYDLILEESRAARVSKR